MFYTNYYSAKGVQSLEEAYVFGYECARGELNEEANPFQANTLKHEQWSDGWWADFYEEKPAFELNGDYEVVHQPVYVNDHDYHEHHQHFFMCFLEISGVLVVSAFVGYQLIELVA